MVSTGIADDGLELVDLRAQADVDLIAAAYHELMLPTILLPEERQPLEIWTHRLGAEPPPAPTPFVIGVVAGWALDHPSRRRLAGYLMLEYYRVSHTALISYVGVQTVHRRAGISRQMLRFARRLLAEADSEDRGEATPSTPGLGPARATWAEIHIPDRVGPDREPMETLDRVRAFASLGASVVPINYVQPALQVGQDFGRSLMLLTLADQDRAPAPTRVAASVVRDFLMEYYRSCGVATPDSTPEYRSVIESLAAAAAGRPGFDLPGSCRGIIGVASVDAD